MKPAIIGTGYYSTHQTDYEKQDFLTLWEICVGKRDVVVVDNSEEGVGYVASGITVIRIDNNLGHVGGHLEKFRPHLLGWSMSWILPAWVAYSEQRDFIYIEQDCLVFGDWEKSILDGSKSPPVPPKRKPGKPGMGEFSGSSGSSG